MRKLQAIVLGTAMAIAITLPSVAQETQETGRYRLFQGQVTDGAPTPPCR